MIEHPFIDVLKTLSEEETREFRKFLESPYFNTSETVIRSYDAIMKFHPNFENDTLTKEYLYDSLNCGKSYKDSTVRAILFDLLRLSERYLKQNNFDNSRYGTNVHLLDELLRRELTDLFPKNSKLIESTFTGDGKIEGAYFLDKYEYEVDRLNFELIYGNASNRANIKSNMDRLSSIGKNLLGYFIIELMKIHKNAVTYSLNYGIDISEIPLTKIIESLNLTNVLDELKQISAENNFVFDIYYNLYKCFTNFDDESYYFKYKSALFENSDSFSRDEKEFLYVRLLEYCFRKNQQKKSNYDFEQELFDIYEIFLIYEYYRTYTNIYLPVPLYRIILLHALKLQKYDWLELFVNFYLTKVRPDQQENLYNYTYANLHFAKKEYVKSLEYLMKVDYDHFDFRLDMKNLLLKIYCELGYIESAFSLIDCYRHFIRKNKLVSQSRKTEHGNFIDMVHKLLKMKTKGDYGDAGLLKREIEKAEHLESREWLIEKAKDLTKIYKRAV